MNIIKIHHCSRIHHTLALIYQNTEPRAACGHDSKPSAVRPALINTRDPQHDTVYVYGHPTPYTYVYRMRYIGSHVLVVIN